MNPNPNPISPKVKAGAGGGGAGLAIAVIIVWILSANGIEVPTEAATAMGSLLSIVLGAFAGYDRPDPLRGDYIADHPTDGL